jgi:hypothetical protein
MVRHGLDRLSPPELEVAVRELTHDRGAFLGLLAAASDYPRVSMAAVRRPDPAAIARLDRSLPRARAVVAPEDTCAVAVAAIHFEAVLALDPLWDAPELLYGAWHARGGITTGHGQALLRLAAPTAHLGPLIAEGAVWLVPDHLPGSWQPYPTKRGSEHGPAQALARAARLVYWADRLRGVVVTTDPPVVAMLRLLTRPNDDERPLALREPALVDVPTERGRDPDGRAEWQAWAALVRETSDMGRRHAAAQAGELAGRADASGEPTPWVLGLGPAELPDVALALRRAQAGRDPDSGPRGVPIRLRRPSLTLYRAP